MINIDHYMNMNRRRLENSTVTKSLACLAVVSVSFEPSGVSTKDARGYWAKRSKKVGEGGGAGKERKRRLAQR